MTVTSLNPLTVNWAGSDQIDAITETDKWRWSPKQIPYENLSSQIWFKNNITYEETESIHPYISSYILGIIKKLGYVHDVNLQYFNDKESKSVINFKGGKVVPCTKLKYERLEVYKCEREHDEALYLYYSTNYDNDLEKARELLEILKTDLKKTEMSKIIDNLEVRLILEKGETHGFLREFEHERISEEYAIKDTVRVVSKKDVIDKLSSSIIVEEYKTPENKEDLENLIEELKVEPAGFKVWKDEKDLEISDINLFSVFKQFYPDVFGGYEKCIEWNEKVPVEIEEVRDMINSDVMFKDSLKLSGLKNIVSRYNLDLIDVNFEDLEGIKSKYETFKKEFNVRSPKIEKEIELQEKSKKINDIKIKIQHSKTVIELANLHTSVLLLDDINVSTFFNDTKVIIKSKNGSVTFEEVKSLRNFYEIEKITLMSIGEKNVESIQGLINGVGFHDNIPTKIPSNLDISELTSVLSNVQTTRVLVKEEGQLRNLIKYLEWNDTWSSGVDCLEDLTLAIEEGSGVCDLDDAFKGLLETKEEVDYIIGINKNLTRHNTRGSSFKKLKISEKELRDILNNTVLTKIQGIDVSSIKEVVKRCAKLPEMVSFLKSSPLLKSKSKCLPGNTLKGYTIYGCNLELVERLDGYLEFLERLRIEESVGEKVDWLYDCLIFRDEVYELVDVEQGGVGWVEREGRVVGAKSVLREGKGIFERFKGVEGQGINVEKKGKDRGGFGKVTCTGMEGTVVEESVSIFNSLVEDYERVKKWEVKAQRVLEREGGTRRETGEAGIPMREIEEVLEEARNMTLEPDAEIVDELREVLGLGEGAGMGDSDEYESESDSGGSSSSESDEEVRRNTFDVVLSS